MALGARLLVVKGLHACMPVSLFDYVLLQPKDAEIWFRFNTIREQHFGQALIDDQVCLFRM